MTWKINKSMNICHIINEGGKSPKMMGTKKIPKKYTIGRD